MKPSMTPWNPSPREDEFLRLLYRLHLLRNDHFVRRFYSETSRKTALKRTADLVAHDFLSVHLQPTINWRPPRYYRLTARALNYLRDTGTTIPTRTRGTDDEPSFLFLEHTFSVNHFLVDLERFADETPGVRLDEMRHELDFKLNPSVYQTKDGRVSVAPDAWFRLNVNGRENCVSLELDRGTEDQAHWQKKVRALVGWVDGGAYGQQFASESLAIAVDVVSGTHRDTSDPARFRRVESLMRWTQLVLDELKLPEYGSLFLFTVRDPATTAPDELFTQPVWRELSSHEPVRLLAGLDRPPA